jgi:mono/diheme cytochrome c family protein
MRRYARQYSALFTLALLAACSGSTGAVSETPAPVAAEPVEDDEDPTTADGIFTLAQADRGEDLFRSICSDCHDQADWTEEGFKGRWEGQSVFQFWYYINDRMPYDNPFSLTREQVTDVVTYILTLNGLPAGDTELATDDDSIDDYWLTWVAHQ